MSKAVDFAIRQVLDLSRSASDRAILKLAFRIEEHAKENIIDNDQVDTGFMLNSIYVASRDDSGYNEAFSSAHGNDISSRTGYKIDHSDDMAPEVDPREQDADAVVAVGAEYAIYQESQNAFFSPAIKMAVQDVEKIFAEQFRIEGF